MTRSVVLVAGGLCLVALVAGLRLGAGQAGLSETQVINAYAARYVAETNGALTDCAAVPGQGSVWMVIRCGTPGPSGRVFEVGRNGALVNAEPEGPST